MRFLKRSGILAKDAPKAKSSSPWNVQWTRDTTTIEDIKRMNAVMCSYDGLVGAISGIRQTDTPVYSSPWT